MGKVIKKVFKVVSSIFGGGQTVKQPALPPPPPQPEPVKPLPDPLDPNVLLSKKKDTASFYARQLSAKTSVLTGDQEDNPLG